MQFEHLEFNLADGVAHVALNRPERGNALDLAMARELWQAAIRCHDDRAVRCVLLTAKGGMFCAGGDLRAFTEAGTAVGAMVTEMAGCFHAAISLFTRMRAPMVVAVQGAAAGGGFSLALVGDLVLAARSATFTVAYTAAGLTPDGGSTFLLPRLVGLRRAQELILLNRRLTAEEAVDWGLVTRLVDDAALEREARELAARLAAGPTAAFGAARALLAGSVGDRFEAQMQEETTMIARAIAGRDGQEGIRAFLEKRKPGFRGE